MRDEVPAWPPNATASIACVSRPSDAPYSAAARPAGPPPTITRSHIGGGAPRAPRPSTAASSALDGFAKHRVAGDHDGRLGRLDAESPEERVRLLVVLEVHPVVGPAVAREELAQPAGVARVARPDQPLARFEIDQDRPARQVRLQDQV